MSDLLDLAKSMTPKKRNSRLDPYLAELRILKEQGYSLEQMRELLAKVDVKVSRQTIHDFLERREKAGINTTAVSPKNNITLKDGVINPLGHSQETRSTKGKQNEIKPNNPFAKKQTQDGDIRRTNFDYNPKPDKSKIYGYNNDE